MERKTISAPPRVGDEDLMTSKPGSGAESLVQIKKFLPSDILETYEVYSYKHAAALLSTSAPAELEEIMESLRHLQISRSWIQSSGGNESQIPKALSKILRPCGWYETRIKCDLLVTLEIHKETIIRETNIRANFVDGHKIDYLKNSVAFDFEWNSKDQTFDRDLMAMRSFHENGVIIGGIIITRGEDLNNEFRQLGIMSKYGASTTWIGKLLSRLDAGRNGACPILAVGITRKLLTD